MGKLMKVVICFLLLAGVFFCSEVRAAAAPSYALNETYDVSFDSQIVYIAVHKEKLYALLSTGDVFVIDKEGKEEASFKVEAGGKPTSIAVDSKGKIYVLTTVYVEKEYKYKGKTHKRQTPVGVSCTFFDKNGKKPKTKKIKGVMSAISAQSLGSDLAIGDYAQRSVIFFNTKTGKTKKANQGIRLCCGIFDFCKASKSSVLVANLGAFKVQAFKKDGSRGPGFGRRGKGINDFHGCCNPVSVVKLSNGSIVTAEKDPTRVKIYDKTGKNAKVIEGIEELVKGCSHIPLAADSKGNVYLASRSRKIIKCSSK
ncbi:MAG: NHL repeat-containing protein [Planctomycetota bacterium]|jgi:hypothetical protein